MTLFIAAYLAGVLTIATPCIFPILPFVLARTGIPFRRGGLPMLLGLSLAFAAVASLAAFAGGWAVEANRNGRTVALMLMTLFGLTMLLPTLATRLAAPVVAVGSRMLNRSGQPRGVHDATTAGSILLGVATGLVWAPCAGPVLALILTTAALRGPSVETSLLLLTYGAGAATSLAAGMVFGGRLLAAVRRSIRWGEGLRRVLGAGVIAGAATIWLGLDTGPLARWSSAMADGIERNLIAGLPKEPVAIMPAANSTVPLSAPLRSLLGARQWLNTPPLQPADISGKVVLVNFWTYSCINCLRALPHVRAWAETYRDRGLVVVGVHTPEFAFEKDAANVGRAIKSLGIGYPVAIDSDFAIWRAFNNRAWPALYFIGADGRLRHQVLGEGEYEQSEQLIRRLLSQADGLPVSGDSAIVTAAGPQAEADGRNLGSGEAYIGYSQADSFASPGGVWQDAPTRYQAGASLSLNRWSLSGVWTVGGEFATLNEAAGGIAYRFHARDLHLVMAPQAAGHAIRFRIRIDGAAPGADHGSDVDADGWGSVQEGRLYQLVRQTRPVMDRTFEIEFFDSGVRAYAFTFG
jgi:cytochrome c biogenesis protein CcdA/thiol-disulfide isomerase/thioredoxin